MVRSGCTELDIFYGASSLKQQSAGRHIASIGHIIPIPSQRSHVKVNSTLCHAFFLKNMISSIRRSFITCIEHRYAVVLFGFSGHDATFSLM
jgi:hypothetical protein